MYSFYMTYGTIILFLQDPWYYYLIFAWYYLRVAYIYPNQDSFPHLEKEGKYCSHDMSYSQLLLVCN